MGCYDSVWIPCPRCKQPCEAQSKGGPCLLEDYTLDNAPEDVLSDVNRHAPFTCDCGCVFVVVKREVYRIHAVKNRGIHEVKK